MNAALNGLVYQPRPSYSGPDNFNILFGDLDDGFSADKSVAINVTALGTPTIIAPASASLVMNGTVTFSATNGDAISVADAAAGSNSDSMSLSATHGALTLASTAGLTFITGSNGSASFTVNGPVNNLNNALSGLVYAPAANYAGPDSLSISASDPSDGQSGSGSVAITVSPPAPSITAPLSASLTQNGSFVFSGGDTISATDANPGAVDSLSLSVVDGKLTLGSTTGLTFSAGSNGASSMMVTGIPANLNAALSGLVYTPNAGYFGPDSLQMSVNDTGDSLTGSATVSLTVNPAPVVTAPATASVTENTSLMFSGTISLADAVASGTSDSLTLTVTHGTLTLATTSGLTFSTGSNGAASFTVTGSVASLNTALNGLTYRPTAGYSGSDSLAISLTDSGDGLSASTSVALVVNAPAPPSITAPATATVLQNGTLAFTSTNAISVADPAPGNGSDSLTLTVGHGTLTFGSTTGLTFTSGTNGTASFTVTGPVANLNAALGGLTYKPTSGYTGSDSLAILIRDASDSLSASASVALTVNSGSAAPSITAPGSVSGITYGPILFKTISIADSSAGSGIQQLSLKSISGTSGTVPSGTLSLATTSGITFVSGANNSASMVIDGTLAALNAALNGLTFTPTVKISTITLAYTDLGNGQSATASIIVNVSKLIGPPPGGSTAISPDTESTAPVDSQTQWKGLAAAAELLAG